MELSFGWKDVRQKKLFEEMKTLMSLGESWIRPIDGESLVEHTKNKFGIDYKTWIDVAMAGNIIIMLIMAGMDD